MYHCSEKGREKLQSTLNNTGYCVLVFSVYSERPSPKFSVTCWVVYRVVVTTPLTSLCTIYYGAVRSWDPVMVLVSEDDWKSSVHHTRSVYKRKNR